MIDQNVPDTFDMDKSFTSFDTFNKFFKRSQSLESNKQAKFVQSQNIHYHTLRSQYKELKRNSAQVKEGAIQTVIDKENKIRYLLSQLEYTKTYYQNLLEKAQKQIESQQKDIESLNEKNELLQEMSLQLTTSIKNAKDDNHTFVYDIKLNDESQQQYLDHVISQQIQNSNDQFLELSNYYKNLTESQEQLAQEDIRELFLQIQKMKQAHEIEIKNINRDCQNQIIKFQEFTTQKLETQEKKHAQICQDYEQKLENFKNKEQTWQQKLNYLKESQSNLEQNNQMFQKNDQICQTQIENLQKHNKQLELIIKEKEEIYNQLKSNFDQIYEDYQNVQQQLDIQKIKLKNNIQSSTSNMDNQSQISWFKKIRQDKSIDFQKENQPLILPTFYNNHKISYDTENPMSSIDRIIYRQESTAKKNSKPKISGSPRKKSQNSISNSSLKPFSHRMSNESFPLTANKSDTQQEASFTQNSTPSFLTMIENDKLGDRDAYMKELYHVYDKYKVKIAQANQAYSSRQKNYNQLFEDITYEMQSFYKHLDEQHQMILNAIQIKTVTKFDQTMFDLLRDNKIIDIQITKYIQVGSNIFYVFKITDKLVNKDWTFRLRFSQIHTFFQKIFPFLKKPSLKIPQKKFFKNTSQEFLNQRLQDIRQFFSQILLSLDSVDQGLIKEFIYMCMSQEKYCFDQVFLSYETFFNDLGFKLNAERFKGYINTLSQKIKNIEQDIDILEKNDIFLILELSRQKIGCARS